jgi:hypothetical protein
MLGIDGFDFSTLPGLLTVVPYLMVGFVAIALASGLGLMSPTVFIPSHGYITEADKSLEHKKTAFALLLTFSILFLAIGWWSFSQVGLMLFK